MSSNEELCAKIRAVADRAYWLRIAKENQMTRDAERDENHALQSLELTVRQFETRQTDTIVVRALNDLEKKILRDRYGMSIKKCKNHWNEPAFCITLKKIKNPK